MFQKFLLVIICAFSCTLHAQEYNCTLRGFAGYNSVSFRTHPTTKAKVEGGQVIGLSAGYRFNSLIRAEMEASYRVNQVHSVKISGPHKEFMIPMNRKLESFSILGNMIVTWPHHYFIQPYFGGGVGVTAEYADWIIALIENNVWHDFEEGKRLGTCYQVIAGIHLPPYENIYCGIEFRFLDSVLDHMCCCNRSVLFTCRKEF